MYKLIFGKKAEYIFVIIAMVLFVINIWIFINKYELEDKEREDVLLDNLLYEIFIESSYQFELQNKRRIIFDWDTDIEAWHLKYKGKIPLKISPYFEKGSINIRKEKALFPGIESAHILPENIDNLILYVFDLSKRAQSRLWCINAGSCDIDIVLTEEGNDIYIAVITID